MDTMFMYYGDIKTAVSHKGIVVCAIMATGYKDEDGKSEYVVGHSAVQNGVKYDKAFSKAVAKYRACAIAKKAGHLGIEVDYARELNGVLISRSTHVRKLKAVGTGIYKKYIKTKELFTSLDFEPMTGLILYIDNNDNLRSTVDKQIREYFSSAGTFPSFVTKVMSTSSW